MALKLYNTLGRELQEFNSLEPGRASLYTCGPTVYDYPHIGNYRAYLFADLLQRTLHYHGYRVKQVMNLTDVDDKTIRASQAAGKSLADFTEFYIQAFFRDRDALNIIPAEHYPKASDHIPPMVKLIETLLKKGYAYRSADGSIYFSIAKDRDYGKLSQIAPQKLSPGASGRVIADEYSKENVQDFALWKAWTPADGEVYWETALGKGRPGWHIECSAMSMENLGEHFDLHTGGVDNIFPHHENEIAQSECATGQPFANYWLHNEWLLVDGKKMAKSAGNFYTLRDLTARGYSPLAFRYLTLTTHYRKPLNFNWEALNAAETALGRLNNLIRAWPPGGQPDPSSTAQFTAAISDDLNAPQALAVLWAVATSSPLAPADKKATLLSFDQVLGLGLEKLEPLTIPPAAEALLQARETARREGDFATADLLRQQLLEEYRLIIEDTPEGPRLKNQ